MRPPVSQSRQARIHRSKRGEAIPVTPAAGDTPWRYLTVCRLTIIVPYDRDEAAFETTLVSVLENRPDHSEVVVTHDGSYSDPFDLGDEVRFVVAEAGDSLELIRAAVTSALGRVVHVLRVGARATAGWADEPVELFEKSDLASVAPVLCEPSKGNRIVAAGWRDDARGLRRPIAAAARQLNRRDTASIMGSYLAASFWRRATIEALLEMPVGAAPSVVDYAWAHALQSAGWRCRISSESRVLAAPSLIIPAEGTRRAAAAMQRVRTAVRSERLASVGTAAAVAVLCRPVSAAAWGEAMGRMMATAAGERQARNLGAAIRRFAEHASPDAAEPRILSLPQQPQQPSEFRRAA